MCLMVQIHACCLHGACKVLQVHACKLWVVQCNACGHRACLLAWLTCAMKQNHISLVLSYVVQPDAP